MEIQKLSQRFFVRELNREDIDLIFELSCQNKQFYQYHPPFVTRESIQDDMEDLPPGKGYEDKFYIGFFEQEHLVAIMDLIRGYPTQDTAYIGLFMMNMDDQKRGIGSKIISECSDCLRDCGFQKIRLGVDKENPQSNAFWRKNGFGTVGFRTVGERSYRIMELNL